MKVFLTTKDGNEVDVTDVMSLNLEVPLKEILGYSFCKSLNKYIPIYNREKFEVYHDHYIYPDDKIEKVIRWESCGTLENEIKPEITIDEYYEKACPLRAGKIK